MTAGRRGFQTYLFRLVFSFFKNSLTSVLMMPLADSNFGCFYASLRYITPAAGENFPPLARLTER